jgi:hypothetical protein|tara:strand:+ start:110 stop:322 length:213 start_codon:yes stop_codon:yes gene_type:complete
VNKIISTFYKESPESPRAEVVNVDGVLRIEYYNSIGDNKPFMVESFPNNHLNYVEDVADNWVRGIKVLHG